jgi:hypothetical protein
MAKNLKLMSGMRTKLTLALTNISVKKIKSHGNSV